jgi:hypothetical protein
MSKANDPPLALGEIIDRIEEMREELLILQRSLEKMELAEPAAPEDGAANGFKADGRHSFRDESEIGLGSIRFRRPL